MGNSSTQAIKMFLCVKLFCRNTALLFMGCFVSLMSAGFLPKLSISLQLIKTLVWIWALEVKVRPAGGALRVSNCYSLSS